jgi:flagellar basal-body rod protein FlgF
MDRMLYVAMTGARETLRAQAANNHNLANASTTGFRADLQAFQARHVTGDGFDSRVFATASTTGFDTTAGTLVPTGRELECTPPEKTMSPVASTVMSPT